MARTNKKTRRSFFSANSVGVNSAAASSAAAASPAAKFPAATFFAVIFLAAALIAALAFSLCGCDNKNTPTNSDTLHIGVRSDVMGFGYFNKETNKYYGLEIDIANEVANRLGYKNVDFSSVLPDDRKDSLQNGDVECLIACYSITDSRLKNFDFSPAYYEDHAVFMVERSSMIDNIDQLKGKTIATMSGANTAPELISQLTTEGKTSGQPISANEDNTDVQFDNFHLVQFSSYEELSDALEVGKVDAICLDEAIAKTFMLDNRKLLDYTGKTQSYGVATQKDSTLSEPISKTIQSMLDDGTIATLIDKWD